MITVHIESAFGSFRQAFARSFAETYPLPPPATIYGMLLSLVGEYFRVRHEGVKLAFAFKKMPRVATTIRKLSRYKYGVANKQSKLGNAPDYIETLCGIEFLCWIDSSDEKPGEDGDSKGATLEERLLTALQNPSEITRRGVLSLGLSDDAVNDVSLCKQIESGWHCLLPNGSMGLSLVDESTGEQYKWHRLLPNDKGSLELPAWADHVRGFDTRWQRYELEKEASEIVSPPNDETWRWTQIIDPRQ